ncbi:ATP-binding cassette domain-containing protein [Rhodovarius sp.]|uniref:ATP-binding cassette domain-containing protein n=1 Tax=Rhodovarius sp. TaxID=2972673 RepID=UPI003340C45C
MGFQAAIEDLAALAADPEQPTITVSVGTADSLVLRDLEVAFADGTTVIAESSVEIRAGERVLIKGASGSGKSTLFRAIGGLWPWGAGEIITPPAASMMFMPQRPYLPLGTFHAALSYPAATDAFSDDKAREALRLVGLAHLAPSLDEEERWDRVLSLGEQQRMAFARLLLHKPAWIFMDEATAALDEPNQDMLMQLVLDRLPHVALVSIGHRQGLEVFHNRTLTLKRQPEGGAQLSLPPRRPRPSTGWVAPGLRDRLRKVMDS